MLPQDVRVRERIVGPDLRVLHERRSRVEGLLDGEHAARQFLVLDLHQRCAQLCGVLGFGGNGGHRFAVVLGLTDGDDRAVLILGPEPGNGLRQVVGRHDQDDSGRRLGFGLVDRDDAGTRRVHLHQLDVEHVGEANVGDVLLGSGDAADASDTLRGCTDETRRHSSTPAAASTASVICS